MEIVIEKKEIVEEKMKII